MARMRLGGSIVVAAALGVLGGLSACTLTPIPDLTSNWSEPCETSLRRCPIEFTLRIAGEKTVELRGDFRDGGWVQGEPMTKQADAWSATVSVPWGAAVQYKFLVDGATWMTDPSNPKTVRDAQGNTNSLVENVTCAKWACLPPG